MRRKYSSSDAVSLLEVAAKHISNTTAITTVQWHAIYMELPGEINRVVTTHKINNSERNSGCSSAERRSVITGHELQLSSLSLDCLLHFYCTSVSWSCENRWISIYMSEELIKHYQLKLKNSSHYSLQNKLSGIKRNVHSFSVICKQEEASMSCLLYRRYQVLLRISTKIQQIHLINLWSQLYSIC